MSAFPPTGRARVRRLLALVATLAFASCALTLTAAAPAHAAVSLPTAAPAAPTPGYEGWAYVVGATSRPAWRWTAAGWQGGSAAPGSAAWTSPWSDTWAWVWRAGAWHAMARADLATWTCSSTSARYVASAGTVVRAGNASTAAISMATAMGDVLVGRCGNGFADAAGLAGGFALVDVLRGAGVVATGYVPMAAITPVATSTGSCASPLQQRIDATPEGGALSLAGCDYAGSFTISRPLTVSGGTIRGATGRPALVVRASDVSVVGVTIVGPQADAYVSDEMGVYVEGSAAAPLSGIVISQCDIGRFGNAGVWAEHVDGVRVDSNSVHDQVYAGIMVLSGRGGSVSANLVRRIGVRGAAANGNNAYGIALTRRSVGTFVENPRSTDIVVRGNTIEDVPTWHALDTHAGWRIAFTGNVVRRASRAIFITSDSSGNDPGQITITGNQFLSPAPVTFNLVPVTLVGVQGATISDNLISGWPAGAEIYDYGNASTGLVVVRNTIAR